MKNKKKKFLNKNLNNKKFLKKMITNQKKKKLLEMKIVVKDQLCKTLIGII